MQRNGWSLTQLSPLGAFPSDMDSELLSLEIMERQS